ncbi:MAG: xanthine dehydrogenase family protein subunit M [Phycisphaerales bacterium]
MSSFAIATPKSYAEASAIATDRRFRLPVIKAGGIDVIDHLKEGLIEPDVVVNIRRVRAQGEPISLAGSTLRIEATATLTEIVESPLVARHAPVLAQALASAATPAVRNVASAAGNLLQRPRCWYYRNDQFDCLKKGGAQCFSVEGENQYHAIFGDGPCHIVHPSNLAPALMVCGATIHLTGSKRESLPIADLFHMPDTGVTSEHTLAPPEVVTHISVDAAPASGCWSIKAKQSHDWPLAFAAASLELSGGVIRRARVCAGAVAPVPWALPKVAEALEGVKIDDDAALVRVAARSVEGAKPMTGNAYKLKLLPVAVVRAVLKAGGRAVEIES